MSMLIPADTAATDSRLTIERVGRGFATLVRYGFSALFLLTGFAKLASGEQFVESLRGYDLVPLAIIDLVAAAVIVSELSLGVWLASGRERRTALAAVAVCLLTLAAILAIATWRGATGSCGCFAGLAESSIGPGAVLRAAALAVLAINAVLVERPRPKFTHT